MKYFMFIIPLFLISCTKAPEIIVKDRECYSYIFDTSDYKDLEDLDINMTTKGSNVIISKNDILKWIKSSKECKAKYRTLLNGVNKFNQKILSRD